MNIVRALFGKNPEVGEKYILDDGDPFRPHLAVIGEIKSGWVRFDRYIGDFKSGSQMDRNTISDFKMFWKRIEDDE